MYTLNFVHRAMALEEIYNLLCDEITLSCEDLSSCREAMHDLGVPGIKFSELALTGNLNIAPAQEYLEDRISVLQQKLDLLEMLTSHIRDTGFGSSTVITDGLPF